MSHDTYMNVSWNMTGSLARRKRRSRRRSQRRGSDDDASEVRRFNTDRGSVAIVGIGGIFPDAPDLTSFWDNIRNGRSAARDVPEGRWIVPPDAAFDPEAGAADRVYSRRGCFIDELPAAFRP